MKKHSYEGFHYWFDGYKNAWVIQRDGHPNILFHCDPNENPEREIDEYWRDNKVIGEILKEVRKRETY